MVFDLFWGPRVEALEQKPFRSGQGPYLFVGFCGFWSCPLGLGRKPMVFDLIWGSLVEALTQTPFRSGQGPDVFVFLWFLVVSLRFPVRCPIPLVLF